jgi:hypothetical protein
MTRLVTACRCRFCSTNAVWTPIRTRSPEKTRFGAAKPIFAKFPLPVKLVGFVTVLVKLPPYEEFPGPERGELGILGLSLFVTSQETI